MLRDITTEQIKILQENEHDFNPKQQSFIKSMETFLAIQKMLDKEDIQDLVDRSRKAGALDFADLVRAIGERRDSMRMAIPIEETERVFNAKEFADHCGVSVQLVRRECEKGTIKAKRGLKNSWIISEKELGNPVCQRWLENKKKMWNEIKQAKEELKNSADFIKGLKEIEESRKHGPHL